MARPPKYPEESMTMSYRMPVSKFNEIDKKFKDILKKYQVKKVKPVKK